MVILSKTCHRTPFALPGKLKYPLTPPPRIFSESAHKTCIVSVCELMGVGGWGIVDRNRKGNSTFINLSSKPYLLPEV